MKSADNGQGRWESLPTPERTWIVIRTPALDRPAGPAAAAGSPSPGQEPPSSRRSAVLEWLGRDDVLSQFARFVLVGGLASGFYALLFWPLEQFGSQPANVVAVVFSSILANDLHRRLTFHAERRLSWLMAQWEGGGLSLIGLVATTLALGWLESVSADAGLLVQLALVGAVFATIGCLRFVALRWLFLLRHLRRT
jgi:putative flippase GtrA